jgi:hypothetical protein
MNNDTIDTTYRLVDLINPENCGLEGTTPALALLRPGNIRRDETTRLAIERIEWIASNWGKKSITRQFIIDAEEVPGQWKIGP